HYLHSFPTRRSSDLITMLLAFKFRARTRWVLLVIGSGLIFATVYLRYHYVIDLVGGLVFAVATLYTWKPLATWLLSVRTYLMKRSEEHTSELQSLRH